MVSLSAENLTLYVSLSLNLLQHNSEARKLQVFGKKARLAQLVEHHLDIVELFFTKSQNSLLVVSSKHYEEEDGTCEG